MDERRHCIPLHGLCCAFNKASFAYRLCLQAIIAICTSGFSLVEQSALAVLTIWSSCIIVRRETSRLSCKNLFCIKRNVLPVHEYFSRPVTCTSFPVLSHSTATSCASLMQHSHYIAGRYIVNASSPSPVIAIASSMHVSADMLSMLAVGKHAGFCRENLTTTYEQLSRQFPHFLLSYTRFHSTDIRWNPRCNQFQSHKTNNFMPNLWRRLFLADVEEIATWARESKLC
jgi:hypothetical protein